MSVLSFPALQSSPAISRLRWSWRNRQPVDAFFFDRPIVMLQSDDWGRAGVRDNAGLRELRAEGLDIGARPYDLHSLETAADVTALAEMLARHKDSAGQAPSLQMNFVTSNLDYKSMAAGSYRRLHYKPLSEGWPGKWRRPGLLKAYREGVASGLFVAGFHGATHFCASALENRLMEESREGELLRTLLCAETPYIHSRMPWIGYEYWDRTASAWGEFLPEVEQGAAIRRGMEQMVKLFGAAPVSACAPGYRANAATVRSWRKEGVRVVQTGPGSIVAPHMDAQGVLRLSRNVHIEPATAPDVTLQDSVHKAMRLLEAGFPAVVSLHSINFQSKLSNYRDYTLTHLSQFLAAMERKYPRLLYLNDDSMYELVSRGIVHTKHGAVRVKVRKVHAPGYSFKAGLELQESA